MSAAPKAAQTIAYHLCDPISNTGDCGGCEWTTPDKCDTVANVAKGLNEAEEKHLVLVRSRGRKTT